MNTTSQKLSPLQIFTLCAASSALGTLFFPSLLGINSDASWGVAIVIAALFTAFTASLYLNAMRKNAPNSCNFSSDSRLYCAFKRLILFAAGLFFIAEAALTAFITADATEMYLLEETPNEVLLLALLAAACIVFDAGRQYLARCCVILLLLTVIPLAILISLSLFNIDFGELNALIQPDAASVIHLLPSAILSCSGGAAVIIFANQTADRKDVSAANYGFAASAAVSLLLFASSTGIFTTDGIDVFKYPYVEMARSVSIGTISLTERFDTILLSVMIIAAIMQLAVFCYCASFCFSRAAGLRSHRCFSFLILPVVFSAAYYADIKFIFTLLFKISFWGILIILPAAAIFYLALSFGKRRVKNA